MKCKMRQFAFHTRGLIVTKKLEYAVAVYYKGFCGNLKGFKINKKEYYLFLTDFVGLDCRTIGDWVNGLNVKNIQ